MSIYVLPTSSREKPQFGTSNNMIVLDAFISESHQYSNSVQAHPTEKASAITDDIVSDPFELDVEAVISPYGIGSDDRTTPQRADNAYRQLMGLYHGKSRVSVMTGLRKYSNLVISNITIPRAKENSQTLRFSINFRQVRVVGSTSVAVDALSLVDEYLDTGKIWGEGEIFSVIDKTAVNKDFRKNGNLTTLQHWENLNTGVNVVGSMMWNNSREGQQNPNEFHENQPLTDAPEGEFDISGSDPKYAGNESNNKIDGKRSSGEVQ
jgi:hypothetical protein